MKNYAKLCIVLFVTIIAVESYAQKFAVKAGLNMANMVIEDDYSTESDDYDMKPGFHIGITTEFPLNETFSFETGLLLLNKGTKQDEQITDMGESYSFSMKANLWYLDIPLTAKATFDMGNSKIYGTFGPYVGVGLSGKVKFEFTEDGETESTEEDIEWGSGNDDNLKRLDYGLTVGTGIEINSIQIGLSYDYGLANISPYDEDEDKVANRVFKVSLAYLFGGK